MQNGPLAEGMTSQAVKNVQAHLKAAGFDPQHVNGVFDERTTGMVKAFQSRSKLPVTGTVDARTWKALQKSFILSKSKAAPAQKLGERSGAVKASEVLLKKLGWWDELSEDEKKKASIEARNRLDGLVYSVEKTFSENKDKLDAAAAAEIETAISDSKTALGGDDADAMNSAFERLQTASHKIAEVLYSQTASQPEAGAEQASSASAGADGDSGSAASSDDGDVIDAEYVDVEEEKKD